MQPLLLLQQLLLLQALLLLQPLLLLQAVPLLQALNISGQVMTNKILQEACDQVAAAVREGMSLIFPLGISSGRYFWVVPVLPATS